jgi:integration host factor subunit beta
MATVTKKELADRIADALNEKRVLVKDIVQRLLDEMIAELAKGHRLEFRDFGVFEIRTRKPRMAQNPRTLERVLVPIKTTVKFKVGRLLKDRIQKVTAPPRGRKSERPVAPAASTPVPPPPA